MTGVTTANSDPATAKPKEEMSFRDFLRLVGSDIERFAEHCQMTLTRWRRISIFFMPSIQAVFLYRLGRYFYVKGYMIIPRLTFTLNLMLWGTDITPAARIGRAFYMPHTVGVTIFGWLGDHVTCYAQAAIGGGSGLDERDVGGGPGLPWVGDNSLIGARAMIVGPVKIGAGSFIGANAFVTSDLPENSMVVAEPSRILS